MKQPKRRGGRVPGVPVPSTAKSRAASRVAGWKHGKHARVVSPEEAHRHRLARIEAGRLGSDADRDAIRQLRTAIEGCVRDLGCLERARAKLESDLRDRVLRAKKV